jgi:type II secretion system protein G
MTMVNARKFLVTTSLLLAMSCSRLAVGDNPIGSAGEVVRVQISVGDGDRTETREVAGQTPKQLEDALAKFLLGYLKRRGGRFPTRLIVQTDIEQSRIVQGEFTIELTPGPDGLVDKFAMNRTAGGGPWRSTGHPTADQPGAPAISAALLIAKSITAPWAEEVALEQQRKWRETLMASEQWPQFKRVDSRSVMPKLPGVWRTAPTEGYVHFTEHQFCHLGPSFDAEKWYRTPDYEIQKDGGLWLHYGIFAVTYDVLANDDSLILLEQKTGLPSMLLVRIPMDGPRSPQGLKRYLSKVDVESLAFACRRMMWDVGRYPTELDELVHQPKGDDGEFWEGPYVPEIPSADRWGTPYGYRGPSKTWNGFEVWSLGADGKLGGTGDNADIRHREEPEAEPAAGADAAGRGTAQP